MAITLTQLTATEIAIGVGGLIALIAYAVFIVVPAWTSYGRWWERIAASFMTLFILASLVGVGAGIGGLIVVNWGQWAPGTPREASARWLTVPRLAGLPATPEHAEVPATSAFLEAFADVSAAVESGAGLPEVARATSRALAASVVVVDATGSILAVACGSPADEHAVLTDGQILDLRVADTKVGELRYRARGETPPPALVRYVGTLIGLEVERSRAPERASEAAVAGFLRDLLDRQVTDPHNIV